MSSANNYFELFIKTNWKKTILKPLFNKVQRPVIEL